MGISTNWYVGGIPGKLRVRNEWFSWDFFFFFFLFPVLSLFLVFHVHARKEKRNLQPIRCLGKSEFINKFIHDAINTDSTTDEFQCRILGITKDEVIAIEIGEIRTSDSARELFIHACIPKVSQKKN